MPEFTANWQPTPDGKSHGIPQGEDIVIKDAEGASNYMFYGLLWEVDPPSPSLISVTWDGFNDGPKDGILVIHTQKSITVKDPKTGATSQHDVFLPKGHYKIVLRDDPSPNGSILGETDEFYIY